MLPDTPHVPDAAERGRETRERLLAEMDGQVFGVMAGGAGLAWVLHRALVIATRIHWLLAALCAAGAIVLFIWFVYRTREGAGAATLGYCAATVFLGLMLGVVTTGWISHTLYIQGVAAYSVSGDEPVEAFHQLYFYTLADLIPGIDIVETLHVGSPVQSLGFVAGVPILAFRIYVLWFLFAVFAGWRKKRKAQGRERVGDYVVFAGVLLVFVVVVLRNLPPVEL